MYQQPVTSSSPPDILHVHTKDSSCDMPDDSCVPLALSFFDLPSKDKISPSVACSEVSILNKPLSHPIPDILPSLSIEQKHADYNLLPQLFYPMSSLECVSSSPTETQTYVFSKPIILNCAEFHTMDIEDNVSTFTFTSLL